MQRRLRPLAVLATAAAALLPLAACTATPGGTPSGGGGATSANIASLVQADQKITIDDLQKSLGEPAVKPNTKLCYVTRTLANEFWGFERDGFEAEAQKRGVQYQTFAVNDEASISEQLDKAQSALNQGCTALLASPISATALDSVFTSALAKGVPAIVLNDARSSLPGVAYIGPDAEAIGQSAADYIAHAAAGRGQGRDDRG
jgi:ABC-type sugar transport system substrate-binding protein